MFAAIERARFEDVGFAWLVLADGETFVVVARVDEGAHNPIPGSRSTRSCKKASRGGSQSRQTART